MEPLERLRRLCERRASGELVFASNELDARMYLHHGQLAWATSSSCPPAFVQHLVDRCGLDRDALRELVDECRKGRRPIGDTLVESKLATPFEIRDALRHQIATVLAVLPTESLESARFVERAGADRAYGEAFLFDLADVWPVNAGTYRDDWLARRAFELVGGAERVEVVRSGVVNARYPLEASFEGPSTPIASLARLGIELAVVRGRERTELVQMLDLSRALVVTLGPRTAVRAAMAALVELTGEPREAPVHPLGGRAALRWVGDRPPSLSPRIEEILRTTSELLCIAVGEGRELEWAVGRDGIDFRSLASLIGASAPIFHRADRPISVAFAGEHVWTFGVAIPGRRPRHLWLSLVRSAGLGLGWMLNAMVLRSLTGTEPDPSLQ
jgi:hypothetical protein